MPSVEPPPMSTTRNGPSAGSRSAVAPAKLSWPSSSPLISSGRTPMAASAASKKSAELLASRAAEVAVMRTAVAPCASMAGLVADQHGDGALDGVRIELPGGVDALAQPGDRLLPVEHLALMPGALADQQAGGVRPAIDGGQDRHPPNATGATNPALLAAFRSGLRNGLPQEHEGQGRHGGGASWSASATPKLRSPAGDL